METKKNIFEQKWVFWVSLILLPPLAFWLIMCENYDFTEKQTKALKIGTGIWMVLWVLSARSVTSNNKYNADEAKQQTVVEQNVSNDVQVVDSQTTEVKQATNTANEKAGEKAKIIWKAVADVENAEKDLDDYITNNQDNLDYEIVINKAQSVVDIASSSDKTISAVKYKNIDDVKETAKTYISDMRSYAFFMEYGIKYGKQNFFDSASAYKTYSNNAVLQFSNSIIKFMVDNGYDIETVVDYLNN